MFARNTLCVVTEAGSPLDTGNLVDTLLKPNIRIGTSTPVADPAGDYTWEMFRKVDAMRPGAFDTLSKEAQQLIGGPATPASVNGRSPLLVALDDRRIDLFVTYCSSAQQIVQEFSKSKSVALPPELSVGPEYGLTVSRKAAAGAAAFAIVSAVAAGTGDVEVIRLCSGRTAGWTVAAQAQAASAPVRAEAVSLAADTQLMPRLAPRRGGRSIAHLNRSQAPAMRGVHAALHHIAATVVVVGVVVSVRGQ